MTSFLHRFAQQLHLGFMAEHPAVPAPHPHTLAGYYDQFDRLDDLLAHTDCYAPEAEEARRGTLELAEELAPLNPSMALRALTKTASSCNIWGDHNDPLWRAGMRIAHNLEQAHPAAALKFAFTSLSLAQPGRMHAEAFTLACHLLPAAANEDQHVAEDYATQLPRQAYSLSEQQELQTATRQMKRPERRAPALSATN